VQDRSRAVVQAGTHDHRPGAVALDHERVTELGHGRRPREHDIALAGAEAGAVPSGQGHHPATEVAAGDAGVEGTVARDHAARPAPGLERLRFEHDALPGPADEVRRRGPGPGAAGRPRRVPGQCLAEELVLLAVPVHAVRVVHPARGRSEVKGRALPRAGHVHMLAAAGTAPVRDDPRKPRPRLRGDLEESALRDDWLPSTPVGTPAPPRRARGRATFHPFARLCA
jgi:hypothetical protein